MGSSALAGCNTTQASKASYCEQTKNPGKKGEEGVVNRKKKKKVIERRRDGNSRALLAAAATVLPIEIISIPEERTTILKREKLKGKRGKKLTIRKVGKGGKKNSHARKIRPRAALVFRIPSLALPKDPSISDQLKKKEEEKLTRGRPSRSVESSAFGAGTCLYDPQALPKACTTQTTVHLPIRERKGYWKKGRRGWLLSNLANC